MCTLSSPTFWVRFFSEFWCHRCGSYEGYISRPRTLFEKYGLRLLFLRPARCGDCYRRSYRPLSVPLQPRPEPLKLNSQKLAEIVSAESHVPQSAEPHVPQKETCEPPSQDCRIA
jgi:hypothetical protein